MACIIVLPCHFKNDTELCRTTVTRMQTALKILKEGDHIYATGDVPRVLGGPTLGRLTCNWFVTTRGIPQGMVWCIRGGLGTFSEARITCKLLAGQAITVISSSWDMFQRKPIWRRRARENGVKISFVSVPNTGGWRTKVTYTILGLVVWTAVLTGTTNVLEKILTNSQKRRQEGFTWNGCR